MVTVRASSSQSEEWVTNRRTTPATTSPTATASRTRSTATSERRRAGAVVTGAGARRVRRSTSTTVEGGLARLIRLLSGGPAVGEGYLTYPLRPQFKNAPDR